MQRIKLYIERAIRIVSGVADELTKTGRSFLISTPCRNFSAGAGKRASDNEKATFTDASGWYGGKALRKIGFSSRVLFSDIYMFRPSHQGCVFRH